MLIDFKKAVAKHRMQIKGCLHVGAHFGQEYNMYRELGIEKMMFFEPCKEAFEVLRDTLLPLGALCYNVACGSMEGYFKMNTETANRGMSNSLLKPVKHLDQYPSIVFTSTETVTVRRLDNIFTNLASFLSEFDRTQYNLLTMDVQGYELEVLKGAPETLQHIDYIYTEVNRDEVYEGCAKVWELDAFLKDFMRVETSWAGGTWGDAIYKRTNI